MNRLGANARGWVWGLLGIEHYDVFISYRRKHAAELAQLLHRELEDRGLRVFLDVRELGAGPFDEALLRRIERAPDFIVILTEGCLAECAKPGDWLTKEIAHAFDTGRNVVPVAVSGFECPPAEQLPPALVELPRRQWARYDHTFSDESIERLYRMLSSRRRGVAVGKWSVGRLARWGAVAFAGLMLLLFVIGLLTGSPPSPLLPVPAGGVIPQRPLYCCDIYGNHRSSSSRTPDRSDRTASA